MSALLWALPGLPALAGVGLLVTGRRADARAPSAALAVLAVTAVLAGWAVATRPTVVAPWLAGLPAGLAVDGLSAVMVVTVVGVAVAVLGFAAAELAADEARARFFGLLLLFVGGMLATVTATSLGTLLVAWEIMSATSWALIGFWWSDPARPPAANTAFITTRAGDLGLYLAAAAAFAGAGTLDIGAIADGMAAPWRTLVVAGLVLAAAGKSAQLPFSPWLSAAMQGPTPVSALLHSATMVAAGAYLLLRFEPVIAATAWGPPTVAWLGVATALLLGVVAVAQRDLKQLLAASTCSQMGFLFLAVGVGAVPGGVAHLVGHAAFKALLFLAAGLFLHALGTKDLGELAGHGRGPLRRGALLTAVGALALAGAPPLSGWVTKDFILAGALHTSQALFAAALAAAFVSAVYAGKIVAALWAAAPASPPAPHHNASGPLLVPLAALAAVAVGWAALGISAVGGRFAALLGVGELREPAPAELALSGTVAVLGLLLAWRWAAAGRLVPWRPRLVPERAVRSAQRWLDLPLLAAVAVVRPTLALGRVLAVGDDRVVDAGIHGVASAGARLSRGSRWFEGGVVERAVALVASAGLGAAAGSRAADDRLVDRAVDRLAAALGGLGRAARRPQTGLLHQYYAQALALLFVLGAAAWVIGALA